MCIFKDFCRICKICHLNPILYCGAPFYFGLCFLITALFCGIISFFFYNKIIFPKTYYQTSCEFLKVEEVLKYDEKDGLIKHFEYRGMYRRGEGSSPTNVLCWGKT